MEVTNIELNLFMNIGVAVVMSVAAYAKGLSLLRDVPMECVPDLVIGALSYNIC